EEVQKVRQEYDPIDQLRSAMLAGGIVDEAKLKDIDRKVKGLVSEAAEFAQNSPEPDPSELHTDVFVTA
ncbi:MAG: thiamine pyrophosphate-dependent enzyme, partial [Kiloniellales bacterium]|nr:thiamine pyrophosphate-dependent enzyme [Kiloniellales bacterium]